MSLTLRPYQSAGIDKIRLLMQQGVKSILFQSPTGSGKTATAAHMIGTSASRGMPSLFIVHRRELVKQSTAAFEKEGIRHGIIAAGFPEDTQRELVQVASIQSLARRLDRIQHPRLVVWDEAHHCAAGSWRTVRQAFPDAFHIGLSATPERLDGKGLAEYFSELVTGPSVQDLTRDGFLAPYKLYAPSTPDLSGVHKRMGDYASNELSLAIDKPTITGDAIREYTKRAAGKRAVVFCVSIEHSKHVAASFCAGGYRAAHIDGETEQSERDALIASFRSGGIDVLCNVELFGEGFDLPSLEVAILLRPTASLGLHLQQVGRALRPSPGKDHAIILDHAGNSMRHGLPDEDREWSLEGKAGRAKQQEGAVRIKTCQRCYAVQFPGRLDCQYCGYVFEVTPREVEHVEGDLQEVDVERLRRIRRREQGGAQTLEDLIELGKARGFKNPYGWAKHVFNARQAKKLRGAM